MIYTGRFFCNTERYPYGIHMEGCTSYREIDMIDGRIDPEKVKKLAGCWGVTVTAQGKVRIPVCSYDDVLPLIRKRPER